MIDQAHFHNESIVNQSFVLILISMENTLRKAYDAALKFKAINLAIEEVN